FKEQIMALVREKAEAGDISAVQEVDTDDEAPASATIHDLTEMLQRSLKAGTRTPAKDGSTATTTKESTAKKAAAKKSTSKKTAGNKSTKAEGSTSTTRSAKTTAKKAARRA